MAARVLLGAFWVMVQECLQSTLGNVCFPSDSDHGADIAECLKCAKKRHFFSPLGAFGDNRNFDAVSAFRRSFLL
jgi:hypothetical protein